MVKIILAITLISFIIAAVVIIRLVAKPEIFKEKEIVAEPEVFKEGEIKEIVITENKEEKIEGKEELPKQEETNWQWVRRQNKIYELSSSEINVILKEIQKRFPNKDERLKAISILRLDTPYQLGALGEETGRDRDPIFRLDVADCTIFVLTNVALLHSQNLREAREMMRFLNYQPGKEMTFENRLHFTTYRNMVSPYFQDITEEIAGKERVIAREITLNKVKADGKRIIDIDWQKEVVIKYIPNKYITRELLNRLPEAVGVAFLKEEDEKIGLDVRHEGFLFNGEDLIHASSVQRKVVKVNFLTFFERSRFNGIILFEVK